MAVIKLPEQLKANHVISLLNLLGRYNNDPYIDIDLTCVSFIDLIPMNALLAKVLHWDQEGKKVNLIQSPNSRVHSYMQRMNFYRMCRLDLHEDFHRHPPQGRFSEINNVQGNIDDAAIGIADVIAPDQKDEEDPKKTGFYDFVQYAVSELMLNVNQHAKGYGFISAQYYSQTNEAQICIADIGIGIRNSFIDSDSPLSNQIKNDREALDLALSPEKSSKKHIIDPYSSSPENQGVGLTILKEIVVQSGSSFTILSGNAAIMVNNNNETPFDIDDYTGTLVGFTFNRSKLNEYENLLESAKVKFNLGVSMDSLENIFED